MGQLAGDHFAQSDIGKAHAGRRLDQRSVSPHQLPDAEAHDIDEKMLIRNGGGGAMKKSSLHK